MLEIFFDFALEVLDAALVGVVDLLLSLAVAPPFGVGVNVVAFSFDVAPAFGVVGANFDMAPVVGAGPVFFAAPDVGACVDSFVDGGFSSASGALTLTTIRDPR